MRVLGISGSLRADSFNTQLLHLAAEELPDGIELEVWDGLTAIPPYDQDREHEHDEAVAALAAAVSSADAVLFSSPEYNGSIPGVLKNAVDWLSRRPVGVPLRGKPVAVIGASTGQFGGVWAQAELRKVLAIVGAQVVPTELGVAKAHERLDEAPDDLRVALGDLLEELVALAGASATPVAA